MDEMKSGDRLERRRILEERGLGDFAALLVENYDEAALDDAVRDADAPRAPRQAKRDFDLGAFYDRIGVAREEAASLQRILDADARRHEGGAATERGLDTDLFRLESLLATLDIDLKLEEIRERRPDAPRKGAAALRASKEGLPGQGGCRTENPVETAGRRLDEALAAMEEAAEAPERAVVAEGGGRMAVILDKALTHQLRLAAASEGARPEAYLSARLRQTLRG